MRQAGVEVIEARISYLAYAREIAAAMLQRQQAGAIIAARAQIVAGAVGMVEHALEMLSEKQVVELDARAPGGDGEQPAGGAVRPRGPAAGAEHRHAVQLIRSSRPRARFPGLIPHSGATHVPRSRTDTCAPRFAPPPRLVGELVELKIDTGTLHGIIDLPACPGPWPVVFLHAGSGPTDRDGNGPLMRTDNLKMLGRGLAAEGFAVLRIDKRGIGGERQCDDERGGCAPRHLRGGRGGVGGLSAKDPRFTKVGYIGHSEGSLIGLVPRRTRSRRVRLAVRPGPPLRRPGPRATQGGTPERPARGERHDHRGTRVRPVREGRARKLKPLFRPSVQPFLIERSAGDPAKLAAACPGPVLVVSGLHRHPGPGRRRQALVGANPKAKW